MSNKIAETEKSHDDSFPNVLLDSPVPQEDMTVFQIFFLTENENDSVEVLETNIIDYEEINQRLNMGESIFIKHKTRDILEQDIETDKENKPWYLNRC
jgi:hypothetical protein